MRLGVLYITVLLLLSACTAGFDLQSVKYDALFNDSNSKVWLMNKHWVNGVNISPYNFPDKNMVIFYNSGKVYIVPVKGLGTKLPIKGTYYVDSDEKLLEMTFKKEKWVMKMDYITEDSVMLVHTPKSDIEQDFQIIPLPEY